MENDFSQILESLMNKADSGKDIQNVIDDSMSQLSDENRELLSGVNKLLDLFSEKASSLQAARKDGKTRNRWMLDQIDQISNGCSEEEKLEILKAVNIANEESVNSLLEQ